MDRNTHVGRSEPCDASRPSRRGVDRNDYIEALDDQFSGSPLTQGRGSKRSSGAHLPGLSASPLTQGRGSKPSGTSLRRTNLPSPLTQGRGSKLHAGGEMIAPATVAPHAGAWIETVNAHYSASLLRRPSRRGVDRNSLARETSPGVVVAPHAGAWIETLSKARGAHALKGRPSRRGVDRNAEALEPLAQDRGRPSRRGVDRNFGDPLLPEVAPSRPSRRGVDRNPYHHCHLGDNRGRPSRRGVDRNGHPPFDLTHVRVAPHAGAWIETTPIARRKFAIYCRPSRRGVDRNDRYCNGTTPAMVAPHAGAWIETRTSCLSPVTRRVAPHAGAWIETT